MGNLRHSIAILFLAAASLLAFSRQRFESRAVEDVSERPRRTAISPRVALVVLDGMRDDRFRAALPRLREIAERRGSVCSVETPPITFTVAGVYTLGTGDMPSFALVPQNFEAKPTRVDSLPAALGRVGGRTMLLGDPVWRDLFGTHALPGENARDLGPYAEKDDGGIGRLGPALAGRECELCVAHLPRFDSIAHRSGVYSEEYEAYAREVDARLAELSSRFDGAVTWLVTSDHGMFDNGGHGGDDAPARASFLAAWGPGIRQVQCATRLAQADIPTLAAALLGAPIPFQSHGTVPDLAAAPDRAALERELFEQKQTLAKKLAARHGAKTPALDSLEGCRAVIAAAQGAVAHGPMLISIFPLLLAFVSVVRPSRLQAPAVLRSRILPVSIVLVCFGWVFSNAIYPRVPYATATLVAFVVGVAPFAIAWWLASRAALGTAEALAVGIASLIAVESHWIAHMQALVLGFGAFVALAGLERRRRLLAALAAGAATFALVEGSWLRAFALRATPQGPVALGLAALVTAAVLASALPAEWPAARRRIVTGAAAVTYLLVVTAPPFARPWLPFAAAAAWLALAPPRSGGSMEVLAAGFGVLVSMQSSPLHWCALLVAGRLSCELLRAGAVERLFGPRSAPWLRGALILAMGYVLVVLEGNRLRFQDIDVLVGFFGGGIDLHLPVTVALVAAHYAAPIVFVVLFARQRLERNTISSTVTAAAALCLLRLVAILVGFVWGNLAQGSWTMQLTEVLLLSTWTMALLLLLPLVAGGSGEASAS